MVASFSTAIVWSCVTLHWERHGYIVRIAVVVAVYVTMGLFGLSLYPVEGFASLVWPPTGIAICALFFWGYRMWIGVAIGAFLTNLIMGAPLSVALFIALGNTLEATAARYILRDRTDFDPLFSHIRDSLTYIAMSAFVPFISATIGTISLLLGGIVVFQTAPLTWLAWWMGDVLGALVVGAFLIRWIAKPFFRRSTAQTIEVTLALLSLFVANVIAVVNPFPLLSFLPLVYFFIPFLWISIREGPRFTTLASLLMMGFLVWDTLAGIGLFNDHGIPDRMFLSQILIGMLSIIFLIITAAMKERRKTNTILAKNVSELERLLHRFKSDSNAKNDFIAVLAHELRNPLAPILSSIELMKARTPRDVLEAETLETMERSALSMRSLLDDLLDIARISRRGFTLQRERVNLTEIVRTCGINVSSIASERGHTLSVKLPEKILRIDADPLRIEQILLNLLNNAIKYTIDAGRIDVVCEYTKEHAIVRIRDTGMGISPERLPYIFEPFQKNREHNAHRKGGMGIGLSLSKKLVKLHGGSLTVESPGENKGSTFTLRLPLLETSQLSMALGTAKIPPKISATEYGSLRILLVDDNVDAARALGRLLERKGHSLMYAETGAQALSVALEGTFDACIIDIGLPDIDGCTVASRLTAAGYDGTLIALSGYGQDEDRVKALASGFRHHMTKPATLAGIEALLPKGVSERHS